MKDASGVQKKKTARKVNKAGVPYFLFDTGEVEHVVELLRAGDPALNLSIAINPLEAFEATLESADARADATRRLINSLRAQDADLVELNWNKWIAACTSYLKYHAEPKRSAVNKKNGAIGGKVSGRKPVPKRIVEFFKRARKSDSAVKMFDLIEQLATSGTDDLAVEIIGNRKQRTKCRYKVRVNTSDDGQSLPDELVETFEHGQMKDLFKDAK